MKSIMLLPFQGAGILAYIFPGCRCALPRAMCLLPLQGAHTHGYTFFTFKFLPLFERSAFV